MKGRNTEPSRWISGSPDGGNGGPERVAIMVFILKNISFCSPSRKSMRDAKKWSMNIFILPEGPQRYLGRETPGNIRKLYSKVERELKFL